VLAGRRGRVADDRLEDAREDGERRPVLLAVDVDRDDQLRRLLDLGKQPADGGGLPRPRRPAEDRAPGAAAPEGRPGEEGEFADLGVAVVEDVGHVGELEDLAVAKERLVVAKDLSLPHSYVIRRRGYMCPRRAG